MTPFDYFLVIPKNHKTTTKKNDLFRRRKRTFKNLYV
jgi:hypothetical protein